MNAPSSPYDSLVLSYLTLRKAVGILGISLPVVLAVGGTIFCGLELQRSISSYYYSGKRNLFVGILCSIAVFLLSYRGYELQDKIASFLAGLFTLGVAFFPTTSNDTPSETQQLIGYVHLASAAAFFLTISCISLFLFTKTDPTKPPTPKKLQRNKAYKSCGWIILGAIFLIGVYKIIGFYKLASLDNLNPVFWLESVAQLAFGASWLVKGEAILRDEILAE